MVQLRTGELAVLAGRTPLDVSQADYEQARQELTGESDRVRQDAVLNSTREMPDGIAATAAPQELVSERPTRAPA